MSIINTEPLKNPTRLEGFFYYHYIIIELFNIVKVYTSFAEYGALVKNCNLSVFTSILNYNAILGLVFFTLKLYLHFENLELRRRAIEKR